MEMSNACPDQEQIFKVIAGKLGKWPARGKRGEWGGRGGAQGNVILFLTCLSLLNLLIEICMAKLLRTLMPAPFPPPCLHFAICVLVELYKVLCIILHSNNNSKGNNNYLAHDVFLAIELPPSRGTWPNFTADQATATTSSSPLPFLTLLHHHHHHYRRHHHHYRLQVIVIVIITAPIHSFCLA